MISYFVLCEIEMEWITIADPIAVYWSTKSEKKINELRDIGEYAIVKCCAVPCRALQLQIQYVP